MNLEKKVIYDGCKTFEIRRIEHPVLKRALRKQDLTPASDTFQPEHIRDIVGSVCKKKDLLVV